MKTLKCLFACFLVIGLLGMSAQASIIMVPEDYGSIYEAIMAPETQPGDTIMVGEGTFDGCPIEKPVKIIGSGPELTIVNTGTDVGEPDVELSAAFYLPDNIDVSGTKISNLKIECSEACNFGVFSRDQDDVVVSHLTITNAQQGITNSCGSGWNIIHNKIIGTKSYLPPGPSGGWVHIAIYLPSATFYNTVDIVEKNLIAFNDIDITNIEEFGYPGYRFGIYLVVSSADPAYLTNNKVVRNKVHVAGIGSLFAALALHDSKSMQDEQPVRLRDNQIVGLNDFQIENGLSIPAYGRDIGAIPGNYYPYLNPDLRDYNTFSPILTDINIPEGEGDGAINSLNALH